MFARWGHFVHRRRWGVLIVSLLVLAASAAAFTQSGVLTNESSAKVEARIAADKMQAQLPHAGGSQFLLVFDSDRLHVADAEFRRALESAVDPLRRDHRVSAVRTPYDSSAEQAAAMESRDGKQALVVVSVRDDFNKARTEYTQLRSQVRSDVLRIYATGNLAINHDFDVILESDLQRSEIVSLVLSLLLLLLVFATLVAALLPVGVGVLAIVGGVAATFLLARVTDVSQYALNIVTLIGLGVAIDYSLLIVNRYREELYRGIPPAAALATTLATAGRAVTFSALTVAIGLSGMLFYRGTFLASMGLAGATVVAFAIFYALTFLPALLAVLGPRVDFRVLRWIGSAVTRNPTAPVLRPARSHTAGLWHGLATRVMRRPLLVLLPALAVILIAGSPFLSVRLANGDANMLPPTAESRHGYDQLLKNFPGQDQTRISVVVSYPDERPLTPDRVGQLYDYSRRLASLPDVLRVESALNLDPSLQRADYQRLLAGPAESLPPPARDQLRQTVGRQIVVLSVLTAQAPESDGARGLLRAIRADRAVGDGQLLVTGQTAFDVDYIKLILDDTPVAVAAVMAVTYVVLFLMLGSLILPLKALLTNLLSMAASFGAIVWIFQQGHLSAQLGFTPTSIDPTLPVILFCILFGLSMDYEVFLLSRIQEEYRRTGDNRRAVAEGLERSGRLVTGAAAIMVAVFGAFGLAQVVLIKSIGLGLALAVVIDATIVRALIVPAAMRLLGRLNWWAPNPLARFHDWLGLAESTRPTEHAAAEVAR